MSRDALQRLADAQTVLLDALDAGDVAAIEDANALVREAVNVVHATGAWRGDAELRADAAQTLRQADAARGRINLLLDQNRRRIDRLGALSGAPRGGAYRRDGRIA